MAHTLSREKALRRLHAEPLSAWRGWLVYARCTGGHRPRAMSVDAVLALPNPPATVGQLLHRLRCRACGAPPEGMALRQGVDSPVWVTVRLPAHLERQMQEPPGMPGTVRVAWWRR